MEVELLGNFDRNYNRQTYPATNRPRRRIDWVIHRKVTIPIIELQNCDI